VYQTMKLFILLLFAVPSLKTTGGHASAVPAWLDSAVTDSEDTTHRELKRDKVADVTFWDLIPSPGAKLASSSNFFYAKVDDPKGMKEVSFEISHDNGPYKLYKKVSESGSGYGLSLLDMSEGMYSWRIMAKNKKKAKKTSDPTSFTIKRKYITTLRFKQSPLKVLTKVSSLKWAHPNLLLLHQRLQRQIPREIHR
jgi:hypothetical protein